MGIGWRASISGAQLVGHGMAGRGFLSVHFGSSAGCALNGERPFRELSWLDTGKQAEGFRASISGAQLVGHWIAVRGVSKHALGDLVRWGWLAADSKLT